MAAAAGWTTARLNVRDSIDEQGPDAYLEHLAEAGSFEEAERIFDAVEAGINPCRGTSFEDLKRQVEELHG